jgi:hypothetical protein
MKQTGASTELTSTKVSGQNCADMVNGTKHILENGRLLCILHGRQKPLAGNNKGQQTPNNLSDTQSLCGVCIKCKTKMNGY